MNPRKNKNANIANKKHIDFEGNRHIFVKTEVLMSRDPNSCYYNRVFSYFTIVRESDSKTIGRVTEYTTDERLDSLLYRWYHRDHLKPFEFDAQVFFSGSADQPEGEAITKMPYVIIPPNIFHHADGRIDDEIKITLTNPDGYTNQQSYHISKMNRSYIIPLNRFKRLVFVKRAEDDPSDPPKRKYVRKLDEDLYLVMIKSNEYKEHMNQYKEKGTLLYDFFIKEGDWIHVSVEPAPMKEKGRCFDFAYSTMQLIKNLPITKY